MSDKLALAIQGLSALFTGILIGFIMKFNIFKKKNLDIFYLTKIFFFI